jgi:hypothetical protein
MGSVVWVDVASVALGATVVTFTLLATWIPSRSGRDTTVTLDPTGIVRGLTVSGSNTNNTYSPLSVLTTIVSAVEETTVPVVTVASLRGEGILSVCEKAGAQTRTPPIAKIPNMAQNLDVAILFI